MADKIFNVRLRNKIDTLTNWQTENPVLLSGEIAIVDDNGILRMKVGDGTTSFNSLSYLPSPGTLNTTATTSQSTSSSESLSGSVTLHKVSKTGLLSDLTDTTITSPTNGQVLSYDSATSKWVNSNSGSGGSLPSQTGHAGEYLTTDGTDASWNPVCRINLYN